VAAILDHRSRFADEQVVNAMPGQRVAYFLSLTILKDGHSLTGLAGFLRTSDL